MKLMKISNLKKWYIEKTDKEYWKGRINRHVWKLLGAECFKRNDS